MLEYTLPTTSNNIPAMGTKIISSQLIDRVPKTWFETLVKADNELAPALPISWYVARANRKKPTERKITPIHV
jgi:hypothetical protein